MLHCRYSCIGDFSVLSFVRNAVCLQLCQ